MRNPLSILSICLLLTGCHWPGLPMPPKHPQYGALRNIDVELAMVNDTNFYNWPKPVATMEFPRSRSLVADPEDEEVIPPPYVPPPNATVRWPLTWTISAKSVTNHPASFTGLCTVDMIGGPVTERTVQPVNYYTLRDTRTNVLHQAYQTWQAVTNDLQFTNTVTTTNAAGWVGAFTK